MAFFYTVHYQLSTTLEDILSDGLLSRKQIVLLQLIHTESHDGLPVPRKVVEQEMKRWFEMSTSSISKALRALARPPLELVHISEDPASARERLVEISPRGAEFLRRTTARAGDYFATVVKDMRPDLLAHAVAYFDELTRAYQRTPRPSGATVVSELDRAAPRRRG